MYITDYPLWISRYRFEYKNIKEVPEVVFEKINAKLDVLQAAEPLVSIIIAAWNEEVNILRNIASLADQKTSIPIEIIVVDNNSSDQTSFTLSKLSVRKFFQEIQGCGPARQMGLEHARGKYVLLADADCVYSASWVEEMLAELSKTEVVCVYGRYSFIPEPGFPRWKLFMLERMKDIIAEIRHIKRPYLNAFGISMGYVTEYGLKVGHIMNDFRGDDGKLCFDLMKFGKIRQVKSDSARAWTAPRTLQRDGSFSQALFSRLRIESSKMFSFLTYHKPHDTKNVPGE